MEGLYFLKSLTFLNCASRGDEHLLSGHPAATAATAGAAQRSGGTSHAVCRRSAPLLRYSGLSTPNAIPVFV